MPEGFLTLSPRVLLCGGRSAFTVGRVGPFRRHPEPTPGVIFQCPAHSIQTDAGILVAPPFGTLAVTRDELIYQLRDIRHAWPLRSVEGFTATVAPGTTTARLSGGPIVLVSVQHPNDLVKLQQAVRAAQLVP